MRSRAPSVNLNKLVGQEWFFIKDMKSEVIQKQQAGIINFRLESFKELHRICILSCKKKLALTI